MSHFSRTLFVFLILLPAIQGFSQDESTPPQKKEPRSDGLRKITSRRNWDFDVHINEALEANIEAAIENAMKSVDMSLQRLEINIDPIEINLRDLNLNIDPIEIHIPDLNIDIEPIEIDLGDLNTNVDRHHHFDADNEKDSVDADKEDDKVFLNDQSRDDKEKNKNKNKNKDKSDKKDKEKSKGLKKLN